MKEHPLSAVRDCLFGAYIRSYPQYINVPSILNFRTRHSTVIRDAHDMDSTPSWSQSWFASVTCTTQARTFSVTSITGRSYPTQPLLHFCCWNMTTISTRNIFVHTLTKSKSHCITTFSHLFAVDGTQSKHQPTQSGANHPYACAPGLAVWPTSSHKNKCADLCYEFNLIIRHDITN